MQVAAVTRSLPRTLPSLQAGRAIAALLVVLFHTSVSIFQSDKYWHQAPLGGVFDFGNSGIIFFFVLSGFIMYHAHLADFGKPGRVLNFLWKRFRRIYPIYWIVLGFLLPVYLWGRSFGYGWETRPEVIISSFLLLHLYSSYQVVEVSWTLFHEVMFYALFALVIWRPRVGFVAMGLWFAASTQTADPKISGRPLLVYLSYLHLLFGFGIAARMFLQRSTLSRPRPVLLAGIALMMLVGADVDYWNLLSQVWQTLTFGVGSTLALVGAVELQAQGRLRVPGWLILLGDASYAIYLLNLFVLSVLAKLAWSSGVARHVPVTVAFLLIAALATVPGIVVHVAVERPLLAWLGRRPRAAGPAQARVA